MANGNFSKFLLNPPFDYLLDPGFTVNQNVNEPGLIIVSGSFTKPFTTDNVKLSIKYRDSTGNWITGWCKILYSYNQYNENLIAKFEKNYFLNNAILSYNIINNSNFTIVSGDDYLIEQINKSWKNINLDAFFNSIGYIIKPNEVKNLQMKTRYIKKLKPGYYRIKKEILILPSKRTTLLIQEFEIQK